MKRFTRFKELLILGTLCLTPLFVARQAAAQILSGPGWFPCDGYEIGSFCTWAFPDDDTVCEDCAEQHCALSCLGEALTGEEYCLDVSFTTCVGGFIIRPFWAVGTNGPNGGCSS